MEADLPSPGIGFFPQPVRRPQRERTASLPKAFVKRISLPIGAGSF
jgi:hypothetical protein